MVSFSSVSQCIAMCLMVSTIMPSALAAPSPESRTTGSVAKEVAELLKAAISSGLITQIAPDIIAKIKSGDLSQVPANVINELKSKITGDGHFVIPHGCSLPSAHPTGTGSTPIQTQKSHDDLD